MIFLKDLPDHVDPCGENGEFHTFVFDGPRSLKSLFHLKKEKLFTGNTCLPNHLTIRRMTVTRKMMILHSFLLITDFGIAT